MGKATYPNLTKIEFRTEYADGLIIRRATQADPPEWIASAIYQSDPYIFPYWFSNNKTEGIEVLSDLISSKGSYFDYHNIWVAEQHHTIQGALVAFDRHSYFNYDYSGYGKVNRNYDFAIRCLLEGNIPKMQALPKGTVFGAYLAVDQAVRHQKIGIRLYGNFIYNLQQAGFDKFQHYCLKKNKIALEMYHQLGFKKVGKINAFTGDQPIEAYAVVMEREGQQRLPDICKA